MAEAAAAAAAALEQKVAALAAECERTCRGVLGVSVVDLRTGRKLAALRDDEPFLPASSQKVLTSAFALARLGGDFRFDTAAYLVGRDLVVVGDYDPTFGDPDLAARAGTSIYAEMDRWARRIRDACGNAIDGDLVVRGPVDAAACRHPDWPASQHARWYAAPAGPLNFNNNCLDVGFRLPRGGRIVTLIRPTSRFIRVDSRVTLGRRNLWSLVLTDDDAVATIRGTVGQATIDPLPVAVNHPPLLFGRVLAERLARAGVRLAGTVRAAPASQTHLRGAEAVCRTRTDLAVALARANKPSMNVVAECIFLRAGDGAWQSSARLMSKTLAEAYGLDPASFTARDGGGLSRKNLVTPDAMTRLLRAVLRRDDVLAFLMSLPRSGIDGTLRKRLDDDCCRGRVLAKTGSLIGVSSLSGYILDARRRAALAFSMLADDVHGGTWRVKDCQDAVCRLLVDYVDAAAPAAPAGSPRRAPGAPTTRTARPRSPPPGP